MNSVTRYSDPITRNSAARRYAQSVPPNGSALDNQDEWVSPFGNLRVKGCSHLTAAYRSVPRPSSPVCAKASTNCPYLTLESPHHQHQRRPLGKEYGGCPSHQATRMKRAERLGWCGMIISANNIRECTAYSFDPQPRSCAPHSKPTPRGIDFKNPFTMSKRKHFASVPLRSQRI